MGLGEKHQRRGSTVSLCNGLALAQVISSLAMYSMMASVTLAKRQSCSRDRAGSKVREVFHMLEPLAPLKRVVTLEMFYSSCWLMS